MESDNSESEYHYPEDQISFWSILLSYFVFNTPFTSLGLSG